MVASWNLYLVSVVDFYWLQAGIFTYLVADCDLYPVAGKNLYLVVGCDLYLIAGRNLDLAAGCDLLVAGRNRCKVAS